MRRRRPATPTIPRLGACLVAAALACRAEPAGVAIAESATPPPARTSGPAGQSRAQVVKELSDCSREGISRRLGPDYAFYHPSGADEFPEVYLVPARELPKGRGPVRWQWGGPWTPKAGDYSSTQGQILYARDDGIAVDRVTIIEWTNGCFTESPEPPWHGGFRPEPATRAWAASAGDALGVPIAAVRGMGGWSNCALILFSSGHIATAGTATARSTNPILRLPADKLPTAIAVTNKNEFALVTVLDTVAGRGQVAVLALESCGKDTGFVHEWPDRHPCLPNVAVFTGMKLLGFINLPDLRFPTAITAVGNHCPNRLNGKDGHAGLLREYDLAQQADRDAFYKGSNRDFVSTCGFAVVVSRYEGKATFIDLQPLFERVREACFTSEEAFRATRDQGPAPGQWPQTFEAYPAWMPPVVATLDVPEPTAVIASLTGAGKAAACIAARDGTVTVCAVGGLATEAPARPEEVVPSATLRIGRNPTCLTYQKGRPHGFIAACRGDREIVWFELGEGGPTVSRRLRDVRLLDPVWVEQADTHGIETNLITVADFAGRKILNYRYSTLVFATQGGARFGVGADGNAEFECGGIMEFDGSPFCVSATNVN
ncbi:MAG: hypothetical protein BWZ02_02199 [Lentisphaerae bacterium ADurb.BinA184]|nr:MAG: hypothetical protein BWZ02_02199 [Lentisphaerae bacterium ADurb.BinA184]